MSGCKTENPGEPAANLPPDTYISEASAGTTTRISFYGTDKDGFTMRTDLPGMGRRRLLLFPGNKWGETLINLSFKEDL